MQYDALVVGGGFAGLAAATYLARARRRMLVVDSGSPRNRFAAESHGFLGQDGSNPLSILGTAREQLLAYPTAKLVEAEVVEVGGRDDQFHASLSNGESVEARKVILAFGLIDKLPDIAGVEERWGKSVLHCPYCHGIEFSDRQLGVLYAAPKSVHQAVLIAEWGPTTLYLNGTEELDSESQAMLATRGVRVEPALILRLNGPDGELARIEFEGRSCEISALYIAPDSVLSSPIAGQLGCEIVSGPMGPMIATDSAKMTSVPGVYAAGDIARAPHSVSWAVADGVTAGTEAHRALVFGSGVL